LKPGASLMFPLADLQTSFDRGIGLGSQHRADRPLVGSALAALFRLEALARPAVCR